MIRILIVFITFTSSIAMAVDAPSTRTDRGIFSIGLAAGYHEDRILNQDGSYASYKGTQYGVSLDIALFNLGAGDFRIFGSSTSASASGAQLSTDKLKRQETSFGIKIYPNSYYFVAAGVGNMAQKSTISDVEASFTNTITIMGSGLDFKLNENLYLGLHGWYKSGPIKISDNPGILGNSYFESGEALLVLTICPPSTVINFKGSR